MPCSSPPDCRSTIASKRRAWPTASPRPSTRPSSPTSTTPIAPPDAYDGDDSAEAITRCAQIADEFYGDNSNILGWGGFAPLLLPMLVGIFWGAPLVAREIEHGTHRLVWTQGTSRLRWAATKFGLVSIAVLAMTAVFVAMLNWWISPVMQTSGQRFDYIFFDTHGIVVVGYAMFALALGIFAGAVTGRLLPAMATAVVGFVATRLVVTLAARDHYLPTETLRINVAGEALGDSYQQWNLLHGDWIRSRPSDLALGCPAGARLRRDAHHAPGKPVLGLPSHRNGDLPRARHRPAPRHHLLDQASDRLSVGPAERRYALTNGPAAATHRGEAKDASARRLHTLKRNSTTSPSAMT